MTFRHSLRLAATAARANLLPGLLLQAVLLVFLAAYAWHAPTRAVLEQIAAVKHQSGYAFSFVAYVLSAALLPEILKVALLQRGRVTRGNAFDLLTGIPLWGTWGMIVDAFYRLQGGWFGDGSGLWVVLVKVLIDQFLFSPFFGTPLLSAVFHWRDARFSRAVWRRDVFTRRFVFERVFPVQVAGWIVWIPAVSLVYFMPPALQLPVASLIQCFWVLLFTFINRRPDPPPRRS